jgi:hypothetical protein
MAWEEGDALDFGLYFDGPRNNSPPHDRVVGYNIGSN